MHRKSFLKTLIGGGAALPFIGTANTKLEIETLGMQDKSYLPIN